MDLPSLETILNLHHKYAVNDAAFNEVYTHCEIVWRIAAQLIEAKQLPVNAPLVQIGCLLHDIGVYRYFREDGSFDTELPYVQHGVFGYGMLKEEGFSEEICRFANHHTGVGLTKEQIVRRDLPLPHEDFLAGTPEERLVMYADKFHSKVPPSTFETSTTIREQLRAYGEENVLAFDRMLADFGEPNLAVLADAYSQAIR